MSRKLASRLVFKSHVAKATTKSKSLRTTIPQQVSQELGISVYDVLDWSVIEYHGKKGVFVRKME